MLFCLTQQSYENATFKDLNKKSGTVCILLLLKKGRKCAIRCEEKSVPGHKAKLFSLTSNCITS